MDRSTAKANGRMQSVEDWLNEYNSEEVIVDMSQFAQSDSKDLKAAEYKGQNLKVVISGVSTRTYPAKEDQPEQTKPVLAFEGREKVMVVSGGNTKVLCDAYGNQDDSWLGHQIGLSTKEWEVGTGWIITPLDVDPVEFDDKIPF